MIFHILTVCKQKFEALTKCQDGYLHSYLISRQCLWCIPHQAKPSDSEDESGTQSFKTRTGDHLTGILGRGYTQTLHPELLQLENSAHLPEPCQGCGNHSASACKSSTGWVNKVGVCAQSHWKLDRLVYIIPSDLVMWRGDELEPEMKAIFPHPKWELSHRLCTSQGSYGHPQYAHLNMHEYDAPNLNLELFNLGQCPFPLSNAFKGSFGGVCTYFIYLHAEKHAIFIKFYGRTTFLVYFYWGADSHPIDS